MKTYKDILNIYCINLKNRTDRKENFLQEMKKMEFNAKIFEAIKCKQGWRGCAQSHIKLLEYALEKNMDHILIFEDDIFIQDENILKNNINKFFSSKKKWDVLLLGFNTKDYIKCEDYCVQAKYGLTTHGYLVNKHYIKKLLYEFKQCLLNNSPIDTGWNNLIMYDTWYLLIPIQVGQTDGYSDIENKEVAYATNETIMNIPNNPISCYDGLPRYPEKD
tara:strand:+ start:451 stop:1107 length:657 start_codon:yes stop_codon:yes gene_type:complete